MNRIDADLVRAVREEQLRHAFEAARRLQAARDRFIGAVFWYAISFLLPPDWKWAAWLVAFIFLFLALWNAEQSWIERRLSRESFR